MGTQATCADMVCRLRRIGVDELACLIDFGLDTEAVMGGLARLEALKRRVERTSVEPAPPESPG
jgi:hypothetical protein